MKPFEVPGQPRGWSRPEQKGRNRYKDAKTDAYQNAIAWRAKQHFRKPFEGPVMVRFIALFEPAPSWSKKKRAAHMHRPHMLKPDIDNIEKNILDALEGIAFLKDQMVTDVEKKKRWGEHGKLIIWVEPLDVQPEGYVGVTE